MYVALELALVAAICVASTHAAGHLAAHMELRRNVEGFPIIGHLSFFDDRSIGGELKAELKWPDNTAVVSGHYFGYVHSRNDFTSGCNSTGQFVAYKTENSGRALLRPADIIVSAPTDGPPVVQVNQDITLDVGVNSITNNVIVFHDVSVMELLGANMEQIQPGLHQTSAFCGFLYPKCIPRDEL